MFSGLFQGKSLFLKNSRIFQDQTDFQDAYEPCSVLKKKISGKTYFDDDRLGKPLERITLFQGLISQVDNCVKNIQKKRIP